MELQIEARLKKIIDFAETLLLARYKNTSEYDEIFESIEDSNRFHEWEALAQSFLISVFREDGNYCKLFIKNSEFRGEFDNIQSMIERGLAVLKAAKTEIEEGYLKTIESLVSADIFSDFLDMASYLLSEGYKDPAAVMIGSTLEEHLRKLCNKNSIDIEYTNSRGDLVPKKADAMNADLVKANIYNKLDQKSVTTWLDLRNKAAHGNYTEYTKEQVELMLQGVTNFMSRIPL